MALQPLAGTVLSVFLHVSKTTDGGAVNRLLNTDVVVILLFDRNKLLCGIY